MVGRSVAKCADELCTVDGLRGAAILAGMQRGANSITFEFLCFQEPQARAKHFACGLIASAFELFFNKAIEMFTEDVGCFWSHDSLRLNSNARDSEFQTAI